MLSCEWNPTPFVHAVSGRRFVVCRRKGCPKFAFQRSNDKPPRSNCRHAHFSLGDAVAGLIKIGTFGLVKPCRGCKGRIRKLNRFFTTTLPGDLWAMLKQPFNKELWANPDHPAWKRLQGFLAFSPLDQIVAVNGLDSPADNPANDDQNSSPVVKLIDPPHL